MRADYLEGKVMENLSQRLIDKSIEAFMMGLEIYNKPTITYRIEGFSFFIINAWELMLKAELFATLPVFLNTVRKGWARPRNRYEKLTI